MVLETNVIMIAKSFGQTFDGRPKCISGCIERLNASNENFVLQENLSVTMLTSVTGQKPTIITAIKNKLFYVR